VQGCVVIIKAGMDVIKKSQHFFLDKHVEGEVEAAE
jgi:hypothetical protein